MYQDAPSHNAVFSANDLTVRWTRTLDGRINGGLAIVGNTVYVDSFDQHIYALDVNSGKVRWRAAVGNIVMSTPVIARGVVIVGTGRDGFLDSDRTAQMWGRKSGDNIIAFDTRNGRRLWQYHTVGEDMASPAIDGDRLIFANGDLHAYALDLRTGRLLWKRPLSGIDTMASATAADGLAFLSICHNMPHFRETVALQSNTGNIVWKNQNGSCDASPSVENGIVFVDGNDEQVKSPYEFGGVDIVAAIDEHSGRTLWQHASPAGPYSLVASGEHAIAGTAVSGVLYQPIVNANTLIAFDAHDGHILWRVSTSGPVKMSPLVTIGRVVFADTAGILYMVDRESGEVLSARSFRNPFSTSPPIIVDQTLFVVNGKSVMALPWYAP